MNTQMTRTRITFIVVALIAVISVATNVWMMTDSHVLYAKMHPSDVDQTMAARNSYDHQFKLDLTNAAR